MAATGGPAIEPPELEAVRAAFPHLEVLSLIGAGGMGAVFKARQPQLDRLVALKLLASDRTGDERFAERFQREAQALARLSHPHIVTIHDFGKAGPFFFLLMEFVDGVNLRQATAAGRLTPEQALAIVPPICEALQYAHERGIVHRDIKPENLLLDKAGRLKIADFGIARILGASDAASTGSASAGDLTQADALGTPGYMAPEQKATPQVVDHRADIYSLGVVFYEMLTGELPAERLQPPSRKVQVDVRIDEIVLRALEKIPEQRFQQASGMKAELETFAALPRSLGFPQALQRSNEQASEPASSPGPQRLSRTAVIGAAWAALFLVSVVLWFGLKWEMDQPSPRPWWWLCRVLSWTLLPLGATAPVGTTLLGWIAVTQIRRSASALHGLGIAAFDGLLFPVLALNYGLAYLAFAIGKGFFGWSQNYHPVQDAKLATISCVLWVIADFLLIRRVWRAVSAPAASTILLPTTQTVPPVSATN